MSIFKRIGKFLFGDVSDKITQPNKPENEPVKNDTESAHLPDLSYLIEEIEVETKKVEIRERRQNVKEKEELEKKRWTSEVKKIQQIGVESEKRNKKERENIKPKEIKTVQSKTDIRRSIPKALRTKLTLNEGEFEKFDITLRDHQRDSIEALKDVNIGQINIPTGTGKTYIQKHILVKDMINKTKLNQAGVYVIAAHRLTLCTQLFNEVLDLSIRCGINADMVYIGSSRYDFTKLNHDYRGIGFAVAGVDGKNTTSGKEVVKAVNNAKTKNRHVIIVSTYHSFHRLAELDRIDICTFDEAHTTVEDRFTKHISEVKSIIEKQYFFTATRREVGTSGGQADYELYGKVMYEMSPKKAMDKGEIVQPWIHAVFTEEKIIDKTADLVTKTVMSSFLRHKDRIKKDSCEPDKLGAKLLITVDGLTNLHAVYDNTDFQNWCKTNHIRAFAFSSDEGQFIDFNSSTRQITLETMNSLNLNDDAVFFHYDILTEGIDLPAITGVLLLRDLSLIKLLQNIGRGSRLIKEDRKKLYSGDITPIEYTKMIKPYCWVIIPFCSNTESDKAVKIIMDLRDTYDIPFERIEFSDESSSDVEECIPTVTEKCDSKEDKQYIFKHILENTFKNEYYQSFLDFDNKIRGVRNTINKACSI